MADNYLEKQYEAYEARKAAWEKERKYGKKPSPAKRPKTEEKSKGSEETPPITRHCQSIFLGIPEEVFT